MSVLAAWVAAVLLAALAVLQVVVATGRPLGHLVWGGQHRVLPRHLRVGSVLSVPLYALIAVVLLVRAGVVGSPSGVVRAVAWVAFAWFAVGTLLNGISRSRVERAVMTPTCAVLALCSLVVATA